MAENEHAVKPGFMVKILTMKVSAVGNVRAFIDIQVGASLIIRELKIVQQAGQQPWVAMPANAWTDAAGERRFSSLVELKGALKSAVERAVLSAWEEGRHV